MAEYSDLAGDSPIVTNNVELIRALASLNRGDHETALHHTVLWRQREEEKWITDQEIADVCLHSMIAARHLEFWLRQQTSSTGDRDWFIEQRVQLEWFRQRLDVGTGANGFREVVAGLRIAGVDDPSVYPQRASPTPVTRVSLGEAVTRARSIKELRAFLARVDLGIGRHG